MIAKSVAASAQSGVASANGRRGSVLAAAAMTPADDGLHVAQVNGKMFFVVSQLHRGRSQACGQRHIWALERVARHGVAKAHAYQAGSASCAG